MGLYLPCIKCAVTVFFARYKKNLQNVWRCREKFVPLHPLNEKAPVAQLVEHLTLNQGVQGSSPCGCTKYRKVGRT